MLCNVIPGSRGQECWRGQHLVVVVWRLEPTRSSLQAPSTENKCRSLILKSERIGKCLAQILGYRDTLHMHATR